MEWLSPSSDQPRIPRRSGDRDRQHDRGAWNRVSSGRGDRLRRLLRFLRCARVADPPPATIYPHDSRLNTEPVECVVETRDLSCCGIGIGHTQQLYPSQTIVIQAYGKLLLGEIRWCHRVDNQYYIAGCRLVKSLT